MQLAIPVDDFLCDLSTNIKFLDVTCFPNEHGESDLLLRYIHFLFFS